MGGIPTSSVGDPFFKLFLYVFSSCSGCRKGGPNTKWFGKNKTVAYCNACTGGARPKSKSKNPKATACLSARTKSKSPKSKLAI